MLITMDIVSKNLHSIKKISVPIKNSNIRTISSKTIHPRTNRYRNERAQPVEIVQRKTGREILFDPLLNQVSISIIRNHLK